MPRPFLPHESQVITSTTAISLRTERKRSKFADVADQLRDAVHDGTFPPGTPLPTMTDLAAAHDMSVNTAHAGVNQLVAWGYVTVSRGRRAIVNDMERWPSRPVVGTEASATADDLPVAVQRSRTPICQPPAVMSRNRRKIDSHRSSGTSAIRRALPRSASRVRRQRRQMISNSSG